GRLDHFPLDVTVERDRDLLAGIVPADVDKWVLLGELSQRDGQTRTVEGATGVDNRLQRRRGELMSGSVRSGLADAVADLDFADPPQLGDLAGRDRGAPRDGSALEHADRGHLVFVPAAETEPVAGSYRSREHPDIGDLLPGDAAFDLEDRSRDRPVSIAHG